MEMHQIRYFLAVSQKLSFTEAAQECGATQPAVSKAIKLLEAELGASLLSREGKKVILTEFGRSMQPHFERILSEAEAARTIADNFRLLNKAPVKLGVLSSIGPVRLSRFLASFQREFEGVDLTVHEGSLSELRTMLKSGEIDFAILNPLEGQFDDFNRTALYEERYVVVLPPQHRLGNASTIALKDLSGEPYVDRLSCELRETVVALCEDMGIELYANFRSEREDWVQAMVLGRIGFAFMPEYSVTMPGLIQRPLIDPSVTRPISLVSTAGRQFSPAASAFMQAARNFAWPG